MDYITDHAKEMPGTAVTLPASNFHAIEEEFQQMMATSPMTMRIHDEIPAASTRNNSGEPASVMLDLEGRIRDCNEPAEELFGFDHDELVARPIALLLPQLMDIEWIQNGTLNPRLSFFCQIGRQFKAVRRDGTPFATRLFFHDLGNGKTPFLRLIIRRAEGMA